MTEWHQLGVKLEVPPSTLYIIESNHPHDAKRCKTEVLNWWLENALEISWEKLARAVEAVGGHATVAKRLRLKMNPTPKGWEFCLAWGSNMQICEPNCMRLHQNKQCSFYTSKLPELNQFMKTANHWVLFVAYAVIVFTTTVQLAMHAIVYGRPPHWKGLEVDLTR